MTGTQDIGDLAEVPEDQRVDTDDPEPNEDADADLTDVQDGELVDLVASQGDADSPDADRLEELAADPDTLGSEGAS